MIKFSLRCSNGHEFESWFQSGEVFDAQASSGLISCPICRTSSVAKGVMAPALARDRDATAPVSDARSGPPAAPAAESGAPVALLGAADSEVRALLTELRKRILEHSDDLGANFAEEALKIHHGVVPDRPIRGQATFEEARALIEEGVEIMPVPRPPGDLN